MHLDPIVVQFGIIVASHVAQCHAHHIGHMQHISSTAIETSVGCGKDGFLLTFELVNEIEWFYAHDLSFTRLNDINGSLRIEVSWFYQLSPSFRAIYILVL